MKTHEDVTQPDPISCPTVMGLSIFIHPSIHPPHQHSLRPFHTQGLAPNKSKSRTEILHLVLQECSIEQGLGEQILTTLLL